MLVLTRKLGEKIMIKDDICITVIAIQGDRVRLGIAAPKETVVDRQEVHERRKRPSPGEQQTNTH
jgi:carbon storage regulator